MQLTPLAVSCLLLLSLYTHYSLAKKGGGTKTSSSSRSSSTHTSTPKKNNQGTSSQGDRPKQPGQPNQGGHNQGGYNRGGYLNRYPARGSPYGRNYGGYGGHSFYGGHGVSGSHGGYPGGYINQNPNNRVLSPHYSGSFGYGGYRAGEGSPFSQFVLSMNMNPNAKSREFGRRAATAADRKVMTGMALGYGLGRFPRPRFQFHSPQEEYYYNHYMYRKYGVKSTDANDYSRDYSYSQPLQSYDDFMESCMKGTVLLSVESRTQSSKSAAASTNATATTTAATSAPDGNTTDADTAAAENATTTSPTTSGPPNQPEAGPAPSASEAASDAENDDDTVSIVEIGYPALIKQLKARKCLEQYMVSSEKYFKKGAGGVQAHASPSLEMGLHGFGLVTSSVLVMLLNSNGY